MALYTSPQNINIFFMLVSIYILFVSIYQLVITARLLDNAGDASNLQDTVVGIPMTLNILALVLFLILFVVALIKMLCNRGKNREYVFTLVYCIFIILFIASCALPVDIVIFNETGLTLKYVEFCYIVNLAIIIISAFATVLYICAICKNDNLDNIQRRLQLYENDPMYKQNVAESVGKNSESFGLKSTSQLQEICSQPFLPGTQRANIAENDFTKDVCSAALGLSPDNSL